MFYIPVANQEVERCDVDRYCDVGIVGIDDWKPVCLSGILVGRIAGSQEQ